MAAWRKYQRRSISMAALAQRGGIGESNSVIGGGVSYRSVWRMAA